VIGPLGGSGLSGEYSEFADSPFASVDFSGGYSYLETFEDGLFNTPGVTASAGGVTSVVFGPNIHDSVDADDGVKDGSGLAGDSYFSSSGSAGVTFSFSALVLGMLPTHAGLVWTDGAGSISFEAFDQNGISLGTIIGAHANGSFNGETEDDRFYGATNAGGISAIRIANSSGGIEIDHLQYGKQGSTPPSIPLPSSVLLLISGLAGGFAFTRRHRNRPRPS
jgi:hypothetical protein